jgi:uncharacterized protein (DUF488 family)
MLRTLGHGTLSAAAFAATARTAGIELVVDIRRYPGSRRFPQFTSDVMAAWLSDHDLDYCWLASLGGRRTSQKDSRNIALRNEQFRAYADHMASPEFAAGVAQLRALTARHSVAVMCSESVWWRCHRRLLADHLVLVENIIVEHVFSGGRIVAHPVTAGARVRAGHVVYDEIDLQD